MIEYMYEEGVEALMKEPLKVRVNGKVCGEIRKVEGGFQYFPKGMKTGGEIYQTVSSVQKSLVDGG